MKRHTEATKKCQKLQLKVSYKYSENIFLLL